MPDFSIFFQTSGHPDYKCYHNYGQIHQHAAKMIVA